MNKTQLLCLDIDGTILTSKHQITERTKIAIRRVAIEQRIPVVLVSARMPKGILFIAKELNLCFPIICYNGSLVVDNDRKFLLCNYIDVSYIQEIIVIVKKYMISMSLYKDDEWYVEKKDKWIEQEVEITNITPIVEDYQVLCAFWAQEGCNKILCMGNEEEIAVLKNQLTENFQEHLNIYLSKSTYLEIMPKNSSKTSAIKILLGKYGVDKKALIAIGDNYNDIDMIQYAGLGIAMGNSPEEVKCCADEITLANDEDGVAEAIEKYIFQ